MKRSVSVTCAMLPLWLLLLWWLGMGTPIRYSAGQLTAKRSVGIPGNLVVRSYEEVHRALPIQDSSEHLRKYPFAPAPRLVVPQGDYPVALLSSLGELGRSFLSPVLPLLDCAQPAVAAFTCRRFLRTQVQPNAP